MPLLGVTVGIDLNGFLDSEPELTRVRAEKRESKAVGSGSGKLSEAASLFSLAACRKAAPCFRYHPGCRAAKGRVSPVGPLAADRRLIVAPNELHAGRAKQVSAKAWGPIDFSHQRLHRSATFTKTEGC
jgi:hypothetical protein